MNPDEAGALTALIAIILCLLRACVCLRNTLTP